MLLSRNRVNGQILDSSVSPPAAVTFTGAFFRPFRDDRRPEHALLKQVSQAGGTVGYEPILLQFPLNSACTDADPAKQTRKRNAGCDCDSLTAAKRDYWDWPAAFARLRRREINLVRVFAMNGVEFRQPNAGQIDVYPFLRDAATGLWRVKDAVTANTFNRDYFEGFLRPFVETAGQNGIAVQLCLFSYHDLTNLNTDYFKYFPDSPWNQARSSDSAWGGTNLVPTSVRANAEERNVYFTNISKGIINTQDWWVGCVVQTLSGLGNVILELFNEPRSIYKDADNVEHDHRADLADWYDWLVGRILTFAGSWRPLLSVNASELRGNTWDIDFWKSQHRTTFDEVDLISYHGLTGYPARRYAPCGAGAGDYAPVAPQHITNRIAQHTTTYGQQAVIFSTDAVKRPTHELDDIDRPTAKLELDKRDGQLQTTTALPAGSSEEDLLEYSDLYDWAYWTLREAYKPANRGRAHFQNHSIHSASFDRIGAARLGAIPAGQVVGPAYTTADWTRFSAISDPNAGRNFWWAQRHLVTEGGSVTQLGTVDAPVDPRWQMSVETGWHCTFRPALSGWCCFLVSYTPISVSIRSSGASVTPTIVARLHEVVSGALRPPLARNDVLVGPGAAAGTLVVSGDVTAGNTYALVMAGSVTVNYRNRYPGYGEVIVHFPSIRKLVP